MSGWANRLEQGLNRAVQSVEKGVVRASRAVEGGARKTTVKVSGEGAQDRELQRVFNLPETEHILFDASTTAVTDAVFKGRLTCTEGFLCFYSPTKPNPIVVPIPYTIVDRVAEGFVVYPKIAGQAISVVDGAKGEPQVDVGEKVYQAVLLFTNDNHIHTFTHLGNYTMTYNLIRHLWLAGKSLAGMPVPAAIAPVVPTQPQPAVPSAPQEPVGMYPPVETNEVVVAEQVVVAEPVPIADPPAYEPAQPIEPQPEPVKREQWATEQPQTFEPPVAEPVPVAQPVEVQPIATQPTKPSQNQPVDDLAMLQAQMGAGPVQPK